MNILEKRTDGGEKSGVHGYFLIEWKSAFSIVLLRFSPGSREAYHSHAFNAWTWWLKGAALETTIDIETGVAVSAKTYKRSLLPKFTPRDQMHKVMGGERGGWAFSIRGPWAEYWYERRPINPVETQLVKLGKGRKEYECGCC